MEINISWIDFVVMFSTALWLWGENVRGQKPIVFGLVVISTLFS